MNPSGRVTVIGTLNIDRVWQVPALPRPGETLLAQTTSRQFGGKGANQAVAAARQGARVALVGALGEDAEGRAYREHVASEGIEVAAVARVPGVPTGTAHVYVDRRGENTIVVDPGANAHLTAAIVARAPLNADVVLIQLETALEAAVEALRGAAAARVCSVLNASPTNPAFPWGEHAIEAVVVNEHECRECFGETPEGLWSLSAAARGALLAQRKVQHLVVTRGANPTLHLSAGAPEQVATLRVEPRDTVGAGDTFAGALAAELAAGRHWPLALRYANVAAALSTLASGAQTAIPRRAEVEAAMRQPIS
jgi:ribokinase